MGENEINILIKDCENGLLKAFKVLEKTKRISLANYEGSYSFMARCALMLDDSIRAKKYYYKSSRNALLHVKLLHGHYIPYKWHEQIPSFVGTFWVNIIPFLLCDNHQDLKEFATIIERLDGDIYNNKRNIAIFHALKYLLLEDNQKAKDVIGDTYLSSRLEPSIRGLSYTIAGILNNDLALINKGITFEINCHKKINFKNNIFSTFAEKATAWVKLAQIYGFEPDTSSEFIHKALLEKHENIEFEDIKEVYQALEIEGYKSKRFSFQNLKSSFLNFTSK
jgi:hypothetical protein